MQKLEDLREGMQLEGVVTNVTAFGAFVDVGVHLAKRDLPDASKSVRAIAAQQSDGNPGLLGHIARHLAADASAEPLLADAVAARLAGLSTSAQRIFSLLRDADGPLAEDEVERRLELFESDEPLRTLTRARLVRLRRTGDLFELDLYHPRLRA